MDSKALRSLILSKPTLAREPVVIPEWGVDEAAGLFVRELTGKELDEYQSSRVNHDAAGKVTLNLDNSRAKLVSLTLVDSDGNRLFTPADVEQLGALSGRALDQVYAAASRLSGLDSSEKK